jgi:hypothetical protein
MRRSTMLILTAALVLGACDRGAEPELTTTTTTTTVPTPTTSPSPDTTEATVEPGEPTTTTVPPANEVESYEIQVATSSDEGRVLWVTIPAEDYTDRDLENFVVALVDEEEDLFEVHVLDEVEAVDAARVPEADRTEEEQALVDDHYLVSITQGNVVTFHGPFESAGSFLIGS